MKVLKVKRDVEDRKGIVGGSSIGAILGLSTYKSEYDAWEDFTGAEKPPVDKETQEIFDMGHELEGFIARQVERIYGVKVKSSNYAYVHPEHEWLICHPDRIIVGKVDGKTVGVEIKSSSVYDNDRWGEPDTSEVPMDYLCQCHDYMMCGICDVVWLVRFSNNRLSRYIVEKNEDIENTILSKLVKWVNDVNNGYVPAITDYKVACQKYKGLTDGVLEATPEIADTVDELRAQQKINKDSEARIGALKAKIVSYMGDSKKKALMYNGQKLGSWFQVTKTNLDTEALKKAEPNLYLQYEKTISFMQFR